MRIIGITGGTGSGKSTVSAILSGLGAVVIDADAIAREIVSPGENALDEIVDYFGSGILNETGELDRRKLGEIVFNDLKKLEVLNRITHKYIVERIKEKIRKAREESRGETVVVDAPIPVEQGFLDTVDEVWVVTADNDVRIERIMDRSGLTYDEAVSRINSQMKDEDYIKIADEILLNNGSLEELSDRVKELLYKRR